MWYIVLFIVGFLIYALIKRQYSFWEGSGIPHLKSKFPFGNLEAVAKQQRSFGTAIYDIYRKSTSPFLGIYLFFRPAILIRDREIIKNVLTKDFSHFHSRGVYLNPKADKMSANLFSMEGDEWKILRQQLTPAFTSGKLKGMFDHVTAIGSELVEHFRPFASTCSEIDIRDFASSYVADCLASIAFGQEGVSTIKNPNHEFRLNARKLNDNSDIMGVIRRTAVFLCPG
jgi:cytochrome P450 family 6